MSDNELIAQFMGVSTRYDMMGNENPDYNCWDFIMPVCEKINSINLGVTSFMNCMVIISPKRCRIRDGSLYCDNFHFDIYDGNDEDKYTTFSATFQAVVKFIEWYNLNSKTPLSIIKNNG